MHRTVSDAGKQGRIPLALLAVCALLSALGLASFAGRSKSYALLVSLEIWETPALWESTEDFFTLHPEGMTLAAGDTLGWAMEESLWRLLTAWAAGPDPAALSADLVTKTLQSLGLGSRIPELIHTVHRRDLREREGRSGDTRSSRLQVDSLEAALYRLRREWRMSGEGPQRDVLTAAIREAEAALNRARNARERRIRREERSDPSSESAAKSEVRIRALQVLADSLLAAGAVLAPGVGRLESKPSGAKGTDSRRLVSPQSGSWWITGEEAWPAWVEPGRSWTLRHAESPAELEVIIEECLPRRCRIRQVRGTAELPAGRGWRLERPREAAPSTLLRRWMGWRPEFQG